MSSMPGAQMQPQGPPYAPRYASLGGVPSITPDVPVTAVFLFLFVVSAAAHMKIFKGNQMRKHKFVFNGALFGFCVIRIVAMSLRIAWACHSRNVSLGIAAQVFVNVGSIILYIVNWFFAQRIVRAQHPRFGWSIPYRGIFRAAIICLILSLFMLVVGAIQQFFTQNTNILRIDRNLQLAGQTYSTVFSLAPLLAVSLSLVFPRHGTEKFGAGRLRNNIAVLLIAVVILFIGQVFRCATLWLPPASIRNAQGQPQRTPWYFSKACFYGFNFTTEVIVVILYAIMRVDLRFHIPDGSKKPGDYSKRPVSDDNDCTVSIMNKEENFKRHPSTRSEGSIRSNETLHQYEHSLFEETATLADSLRYPSSILEIDPKNGNWKVRRISRGASLSSLPHSNHSLTSLGNKPTPPVPAVPEDWPLRKSQIAQGEVPVLEHRNRSSRSPLGTGRVIQADDPDVEAGNSVEDAFAKLEGNSEASTISQDHENTAIMKKNRYSYKLPNSNQPNSDTLKGHMNTTSSTSSDLPKKYNHSAASTNKTPSFVTASSDLAKKQSNTQTEGMGSPDYSSAGDTSMETESTREIARFSYEASPRGHNLSESEKDHERKSQG